MKRNIVMMITVAGIFFLLGTLSNIASSWIGRRPVPMINGYTGYGYISRPAYDSGWVSIETYPNTIVLTHNLSTTEVFVYLTGKDVSGNVHQWNYGYQEGALDFGAIWHSLTNTHVSISIADTAFEWNQIRIQIWKIA